MAFESEQTEASRKTLDDIRRELDAEYGYIEIPDAPADAGDAAPDPRPRHARAEQRMAAAWNEREDVGDTAEASIADFRAIAERHDLSLGRRAPAEDRSRRSGYLIAAIVGCVAGQALLLAFLTATRYGGTPDLSRTIAAVWPRREAPAPAASRPAIDDPRPNAESDIQADTSAAVTSSPSSSTIAPPDAVQESKSQLPDDLPASVAQEPPASSSRQPAIVSAATVPEASRSRPADGLPPRLAQEPRALSPRRPAVAAASDWAEAQARLRAALNEWLRTSARGGAPVQTTEPVIVLGPDGRTAKTYVSITSPIGLIPREQRWELGPRGWNLVDDRQAGLPRRSPAATPRER